MQQLGCLEAHLCAGVGAAFNDSIELLLRFVCCALLVLRLMLISFPSLSVKSLHNLHRLTIHRGVS